MMRILLLAGVTACGLLSARAEIIFSFSYQDPVGEGFNAAGSLGETRRNTLQTAAGMLSSYFVTSNLVTITYGVTSTNDPMSSNLASAGSNLVSTAPGFWDTVVQQKILTGIDANSAAFDGGIDFNFGNPWSYALDAASVPSDEFDFISTAMHEVMHSFGFLSYIQPTGRGANDAPLGSPDAWTTFDRYFTDINGISLITETFGYNTSVGLAPLTGGAEEGPFAGVLFDGPNARAGYGGNPVQIFSPNPYEDGSSGSHVNDYLFNQPSGLNAEQLMNAASGMGPGIRILSAMELGIMKDLGYAMIPEPSMGGLLLLAGMVGLCVVAFRRSS